MHLFDLGLHFITFIRITWISSLNNSKHTKNNRFLSSEVSYFNGIYGLYDNYVCETAPISIDTWWCVFTFTWLDRHNTTQHNCMIVVEWNYLKSFFCIKIALSYDSHMKMGVKKKKQQIENCNTNAIIYWALE